MKFFEELGDRIQLAWQRADCTDSSLPDIAFAALSEASPSDHVSLEDCLSFGLGPKRLPVQVFGDDNFGQPGLVVYSNGRLSISLLFWLDSTTSIHDHGFSGAFHVLVGGSLHTQFHFEPRRSISEHAILGTLREDRVEILKRGDTRPIRPYGGTIHQLFHLEHPSVTVVVRTMAANVGRPQLDYVRPTFAFSPTYDRAEISKRIQLLKLVNTVQPGRLDEYCRTWLESADYATAFLGLRACAMLLPPEESDSFLSSVVTRHSELVACVREVVEDERRTIFFASKRGLVKDTELRFLLAVLLNVRGRVNVLRLLAERNPAIDPVDFIVEAICKLSQPEGGAPVLGLEPNAVVQSVIRSLFAGNAVQEIFHGVAETVGHGLSSSEEAQIVDLVDALRFSELFRHALSDV